MNLSNRIVSFFILLISLLPFWFLYFLSDILFIVLYYIIGYRKEVIRENLLAAFPNKSKEERESIAKKFYRFLADMILETIKMKSISAEEVKKRIKLNNPEEVYIHMNANRPVMGITGHYGNWELGIHRLSLMTEHPILIIYKPLTNKGFEKIFNDMRARFGAFMVPMKQTFRQILAYKNKPHISMFLSDQTPARSESNYFIPFLSQETLMFQGLEKIAQSTNFPVVYCHINRIRRGYYECTFTTLFDNPKTSAIHEITVSHAKFLENIIYKKPELWLWSHRRWKHKPTT